MTALLRLTVLFVVDFLSFVSSEGELDLPKLSLSCCFVLDACSVGRAAVAPSSCEVLLSLPVKLKLVSTLSLDCLLASWYGGGVDGSSSFF